MWQRLWAGFGKVSAVLVAIGLIVTISKALWPPGPRLKVVAEYSSFTLPPDLVTILDDAERRTSMPYLYEELSKLNEPNATDFRARTRTSDYAKAVSRIVGHDSLRDGTLPSNRYYSFVSLDVRNRGSLPATDVTLDTPLTGLALVTPIDANQTTVPFNRRLKLGELRAKDVKHVDIWSKTRMIQVYEEDFRISCSQGTGSISFGCTVYGLWRFLANYAGPLLFGIGLLVLFISPYVNAYIHERTGGNTDSSGESTEEKAGPTAEGG